MPRFAAPISQVQLGKKIADALDDRREEHITELVPPDDMKVKFDMENFYPEGIHTTPMGVTYAQYAAGGDWEIPVTWVVYWDGKKLRAYFPSGGNPYNRGTKEAYGNYEEVDNPDARKHFGVTSWDDVQPDSNLMLVDIEKRIKVKR
tara:strand:+ start:470 stop:910 length:441 start_codon:yes stop_codon:yes gene_type:complete